MTIGKFGGYLSAVFPSQINVDCTMFCNLACIHCPYETVTKLKGKGRKNLPLALHTKLIDEIATTGKGHCQFLRYTGDGEPLLHPHLPEMIDYAFRKTGLPINITTNGMLLTEERARALIVAGVGVFDVSIDAHSQEVYGVVRVKGDLAVTHECTHRLIRLAKEMGGNTKVMVSFVRQPENEHEAAAFEAYWRDAGADFVVLRNRHSCGGSVSDMRNVLWAQAPVPRKPCLYPWERMVLKADGELTYCPVDWHHIAGVGNFETSTVAEVWQGEKMQALREAHVTGKFGEEHAFCKQCPDWSVTKWPTEGRSYATVMREFQEQNRKADDVSIALRAECA
jgi:radical SAM protein with 4Fe4S-binding SPASM domain